MKMVTNKGDSYKTTLAMEPEISAPKKTTEQKKKKRFFIF